MSGLDFEFHANTNVFIKNGQVSRFHQIISDDGYSEPIFIVDEGFASSTLWKKLVNNIDKTSLKANYILVSGTNEPSYDDVGKYLEIAKQFQSDLIVGVGGGSCMDISKAVAALLRNDGDPLSYRGFHKVINPGVPLYLIPTTSGTGSEAVYNASFVDTKSMKKLGINGKNMFAKKSFLDGEATFSCPPNPLLGSAVDAIVHSLEGYVCNNANPFSDIFAENAINLMVNNISDVKSSTPDPDKRLSLLQGSYLAGIVQMNAGSGIAAAISYPLGVHYSVPHGIGGGMFCLGVARWNCLNGFDKYKNLKNIIPEDVETSIEVVDYLEQLFADIGVPNKLTKFGIKKENLNHLVEIMQPMQLACDQNPIKFSVDSDFKDFIIDYLE